MATFNILGCCVSRDIFRLNENQFGHNILQYVGVGSILNLADKGMSVNEYEFNNVDNNSSQFIKRSIYQDITKTSLSFLFKKDSEYLIIDIANSRYDYIQFRNGVKCVRTPTTIRYIDLCIKKGVIKQGYDILHFDYMGNYEIENNVKTVCNIILQNYPVEKIILNEVKNCYLLLKPDRSAINKFYQFDLLKRQNMLLAYIFDLLKQYLVGCHVIKFPYYMMCDSNHKWGVDSLHYTSGYYIYGMEAINIILKSFDTTYEKCKLDELRMVWSEKYATAYFGLLQNAYLL